MWFDLALARKYVEKIRDGLIALDPAGRDAYTTNAKAYSDQLVSLEAELQAKVATIPADRRKLVTSHDAFPYFAAAFGFEIVGFAQPEPDKMPSAGELAELIDKVRAVKAPAVFSEAGTSPQLAETIAKETGAKVVTDLPTDSLLERPADSFLGLMRVVVDKIVAALK
jgi:ABC-type Zn uptake system ZnuABC Zn-binding protein ZnuA